MLKEEKRLKVGILGLGPISQAAHLESVRRAKNTDLYAVCDVAGDLAQKMAAIHHAQAVYTDYEQMLQDPQVQAVVIGTAHEYHVPLSIQALRAGKHVFVEKPLGMTTEECESLQKEVEKSGLVLQVGNMKRFDPGVAFAKDFVQNEIGEISTLNAWYCDNESRNISCESVMPITETSEGALCSNLKKQKGVLTYKIYDHLSHLVDTARYLAGEIESVKADYVCRGGVHTWQIATRYASGAIGNLDFSLPVRMDWHEGFFLYGENGSVVCKQFNPWYFKSAEVECFSRQDGIFRRPLGADGHAYKLQIEGWADVILHNAPMRGASVSDGLAAVRALTAICQSLRTDSRIKLSEAEGEI